MDERPTDSTEQSSTNAAPAQHEASTCVACREPIRLGASVCPHCGSAQHPSRWGAVSTGLKWIGGVVTVISLVLGVRTLAEHYGRWQEERAAIDELVSASEWLTQAGNHGQAWTVLESASDLSPSSPRVRGAQASLAKSWLRNFHVHEDANPILDALTEVLYRQLSHASPDETATVLAHVARAEILRLDFGAAHRVDPDELLDQALETGPENPYANLFKAHWLTGKRPVTAGSVEAARPYYSAALTASQSEADRSWVRRMQMDRLAWLSDRGGDETKISASRAFLLAASDMMEAGEPRPHPEARRNVVEAFGFMGRGDGVESRLDVLPPDTYRRVLDWLHEGLDLSASQQAQRVYVEARLAELAGRNDEALQSLDGLMNDDRTNDRLQKLIDQGVLRITGELPPRALVRKYFNDPVDEADPFSFHLETLGHFDPQWMPENRQQAIDFFTAAAESRHERLPEFVRALPEILERVAKVRLEGDERAAANGFTMNYSAGHYRIARATTGELLYLQVLALLATDELDAAIAVAGDLESFVADFDDSFGPFRAGASWQLAIAHAARARRDDSAVDRERAVSHLESAIERGAIDFEIASWPKIKSDLFAAVANEPSYQELARGR